MRLPLLTAVSLVFLIPVQAAAGGSFTEQFEIPSDLTYVGAEICLDCHEDIGGFYDHSPHSADLALVIPGTDIGGCEACHGPGSVHAEEEEDGFILGVDILGNLNDDQRAQMCLQCHTSHKLAWNEGPHAGSEISCNDCHADQAHFGGQATPSGDYRNQAEFCLQCHPEQVSDFRMPFRHRVLEGQMSCGDCHDPHTGFPTSSWNGLNDTCLECHTEMSGPFVFEHEGVSAEDCTACHKPHGSTHDKLLTQDGNTLCLQCHFDTGFNNSGGFFVGDVDHNVSLSSEARCYDCHVEIHGSNVESSFEN